MLRWNTGWWIAQDRLSVSENAIKFLRQPKKDGPYADRIEGYTELLKNPDGRPKLKGISQSH